MSKSRPEQAAPSPDQGEDRRWDAVIVGAGMGGGAAGYILARAGLSVLFLEKGHARFVPEDRGLATTPEERLAGGQWPDTVVAEIDGRIAELHAPLGCGVGGSTIIYAAALERFHRSDTESTDALPHPAGDWPIDWSELEPYYAHAERLLGVAGRTSGALHPADHLLFEALRRNGLHPRRLQLGTSRVPDCRGCGGHKCARRCKSDAQRIFVEPAMAHGAIVLSDAEVERIEAGPTAVERVFYRREGVLHAASTRTVILAAGAYRTPALLLASRNMSWPQGLANSRDQVGRNLMFHANEWLAVWPKGAAGRTSGCKTLALDDLWAVDGTRLGGVQATGLSAGYGAILQYLTARFDRGPLRRLRWLRQACKPLARIAAALLGRAAMLVMIVQDYPERENRILFDEAQPGRIRFRYRIPAELRARTALARRHLRHAFRGTPAISLNSGVELNLGHPCGTCRFGDDPRTSVVDASCRAHGLENLYVVDASFMRSSGGTNPSLTIAANALRVGEIVAQRLGACALANWMEAVT
jgi:choline dehydrogenase-like flavoprotein